MNDGKQKPTPLSFAAAAKVLELHEAAAKVLAQEEQMKMDDYTGSFVATGQKTLGASGDPKGEAGAAKPGLGNISVAAQYYEGAVMQQGGEDYGFYNYCEHPMKASTYYEAILRHLNAWWLGENNDPKSGYPHMAHVRASGGIIIDQQEAGRIIDDRPKKLADIHQVWDKISRIKRGD